MSENTSLYCYDLSRKSNFCK